MPDGNNGAVLTREFVPQDLHDRPYLKDFLDKPWEKNTAAEIFKKLDGAESLLGKRPQIPDPKAAKPEELDKFFAQFRPEKPEEYEINGPDGKPVADSQQGFLKAVREAFLAGDISKHQARKFMTKMQEFGVGQSKAQKAEADKKAAEFDTLAKTYLGEQNKDVMAKARAHIKDLAPAAAKANLDKLTDEQTVVLASIVDAIEKKYRPEGDLGGAGKGKNGAGGAGPTGVAEKRDKARQLQAEILKLKPMDPKIDGMQAEVNRLYKEIDAEQSA